MPGVPLERVGLNLLYLVPGAVGGTEIYARRLLEALALERPDVEFTAFSGREAHESLTASGWASNVRHVELPVRAAVKPLRLAAEMTLLPLIAARERVQLLHSLGTTTPPASRGVRVVTVHDLIYEYYPEAFPAAARLGLKAVVPLGARRAHRVQVSSEATKGEVVERFGLPAAKIDVVPLGLGMRDVPEPTPEAELRARLELAGRPVVLTVSAALPHKNLDRLLRAFAQLEQDAMLVVVGHAGRVQEPLTALAEELGVRARVRFTGWVSDEDVEGLYRLAAVFAYPSLHEGFGMPVLEAMRRGVPVASSNATSLPEVVGDAAELFDPLDTAAIAAALRRLLSDGARAQELRERGAERAAGFTWARTARAALASYADAFRGA